MYLSITSGTAHLEPLLSAGLGPQVPVLIFLIFCFVPVWLLKCRFCSLKCRFSEKKKKTQKDQEKYEEQTENNKYVASLTSI